MSNKDNIKFNSNIDITSNIVSVLKNEHNEMFARTRSIDTRASILISILLAILPFYFEILDWNKIKESLYNTCISFKENCMLIFFFLSLITLVSSLIICVIVICSRKYHTFPSDNYLGFDLEDYKKYNVSINEVNVSLIGSYTECININTKIINKKARRFIISIFSTTFFVFFVIITTLCNLL